MAHYDNEREKDIEQSKRPINRDAKEALWVTYD